jgi:hypothetical protein
VVVVVSSWCGGGGDADNATTIGGADHVCLFRTSIDNFKDDIRLLEPFPGLICRRLCSNWE